MTKMEEVRIEVRKAWHTTDKGCESMTLGFDAVNVRVTQTKKGGIFRRILSVPGAIEPKWETLHTNDPKLAEAKVREYLEALASALDEPEAPQSPVPDTSVVEIADPVVAEPVAQLSSSRVPLTPDTLWRLYRETPRFKRLDSETQYDYEKRMPIILAGLGAGTDMESLDADSFEEYELRRLQGGIKYVVTPRTRSGRILPPKEKRSARVGARSVQADLKLFRQMIGWAMQKKTPEGGRLLREDPMIDYVVPKERSPRRAVATDDRFHRTLAALDRLAASTSCEQLAFTYRELRVALITLEGTGRRRSAVLGLDWDDLAEFHDKGRMVPHIHFDRTLDKADRTSWVPIPLELWDELQAWKRERGVCGKGLIFPGIDENTPLSGRWAAELLERAETEAGLAPLNGTLFHAYRRRFATARSHRKAEQVMRLMGIKDAKVFFDCYCHSSTEELNATLLDARPVTDTRLEHAA